MSYHPFYHSTVSPVKMKSFSLSSSAASNITMPGVVASMSQLNSLFHKYYLTSHGLNEGSTILVPPRTLLLLKQVIEGYSVATQKPDQTVRLGYDALSLTPDSSEPGAFIGTLLSSTADTTEYHPPQFINTALEYVSPYSFVRNLFIRNDTDSLYGITPYLRYIEYGPGQAAPDLMTLLLSATVSKVLSYVSNSFSDPIPVPLSKSKAEKILSEISITSTGIVTH